MGKIIPGHHDFDLLIHERQLCNNDKLACSQPITIKEFSHKIIIVIYRSTVLPFYRSTPDAHTTADVDYRWKGGKSQGVEIVSKEMAQFDFVGAKTTTKANTNSKGTTLYINKNR